MRMHVASRTLPEAKLNPIGEDPGGNSGATFRPTVAIRFGGIYTAPQVFSAGIYAPRLADAGNLTPYTSGSTATATVIWDLGRVNTTSLMTVLWAHSLAGVDSLASIDYSDDGVTFTGTVDATAGGAVVLSGSHRYVRFIAVDTGVPASLSITIVKLDTYTVYPPT